MFVDRVRPEGAGPRSPAKRSDTQDLLPCHRRMSLRSCGLLAIEQAASINSGLPLPDGQITCVVISRLVVSLSPRTSMKNHVREN